MSKLGITPDKWRSNGSGISRSSHIATGANASVDSVGISQAVTGTIKSVITNQEYFTDGTVTQGTAILNNAILDPAADTGAAFAAQDGILETKASSNKNFTGTLYGDVGAIYHYGSGTLATPVGVLGLLFNVGAGAITNGYGVRSIASFNPSSPATVSSFAGLSNLLINYGNSTVTNSYGAYLSNPVKIGGTITNNYGLYIENQAAGGTNYNIYSAGSTSTNYFEGRVVGSSIGANTGSNAAIARLDVRTPSGDYTTPIMNLHSDNVSGATTGWNFWIGGPGDYDGSLKIHAEGQPQDSWSLRLLASAEGYGVSSTYGFAAPEFRSTITGRGDSAILKYTTDGANNMSGHVDVGQPYLGGAAPATYFSTRAYVGKTATSLFEVRNWTDDTALFTVNGVDGSVILYPTSSTYTASKTMLKANSTYTLDFVNATAPVMISQTATMIFKQNGYGFGSGTLFQSAATYQNDSGTTRTIGPIAALAHAPTVQSNGGTLTLSYDSGFLQNATYNATAAGTTNVTNSIGAWLQGATVGTSTTVTNAYGILADYTNTVSGTLTSYAAFVSNTLAGTNKTRILLGTATIPSGTWGIYQSSTERNYFAGVSSFSSSGTLGTNEVFRVGAPATIDNNAYAIITAPSTGVKALVVQGQNSMTQPAFQVQNGSGTNLIQVQGGTITLGDGEVIALGTTTGTKIGTNTTHKLGFWNATPIVQPTTAVAAATFVANTSGIANDTATFDGYTIGQVVKALRNAGLLA